MAAIFVVIMVILGMGILYLGGLEQIGAGRRLNREKAFYLAEAGAYRAYAHLRSDIAWEPEAEPVPLGDGSFSVVLEEDEDDRLNVVSTGTVNGVNETVRLVLSSDSGGIFSRGIFGSEKVTVWNNGFVDSYDSDAGPYGASNMGYDGDVGSNKKILVYNNGDVRGDASVSTGNSTDIYDPLNGITGTKNYKAPIRELPQIDIPDDLEGLPYLNHGTPLIAGNYTLTGGVLKVSNNKSITISGGNYRFKSIELSNNATARITGNVRLYIEQDYTLKNNAIFTFDGTSEIYIGGKMTMENGSDIDSPPNASNLALYLTSSETQTFSNNSITTVGVVYAPNAKILISNNAGIFGDVVANEIVIKNNGMVHYDIALRHQHPSGEPGSDDIELTILRWTKPGWVNRLQ